MKRRPVLILTGKAGWIIRSGKAWRLMQRRQSAGGLRK